MALLDVAGQPVVADRGVVDPVDDGVDAGPGPVAVAAGTDDVEQVGKLGADPDGAVVLVGDGIDAKLARQALDVFSASCLPNPVERLGQGVRSAPHRDPQRAFVRALQQFDDAIRPGRVLAVTDAGHAVGRQTLCDAIDSAAGNPRSCFSRFGCTRAYASITVRMDSGATRVFWCTEVVAMSASMSIAFAYNSSRTSDCVSSGSASISVSTTTRWRSWVTDWLAGWLAGARGPRESAPSRGARIPMPSAAVRTTQARNPIRGVMLMSGKR